MHKYLRLIRLNHWIKNFLIFLAIFFSGNLMKYSYYINLLLAFVVFCVSASIIYIFNDMKDIESDKLHPTKKKRALASGEVSIKVALYIIILLFIIDFIFICILYNFVENIFIFIIPLSYIFINFLYTLFLKQIPFLEFLVIVFGFCLRVLYGGIIINIDISIDLFLLIIFGTLYIVLGKRYSEILINGYKSRNTLKFYDKNFLHTSIIINYILTIFLYFLWCLSKFLYYKNIFLTLIIFILIMNRYNKNINNSIGDPIEILSYDKVLVFYIIFYVFIIFSILY